ncbi:MAG: YraN family protein [Hyphomonadaceae bacterium]|nr:YraN family protein [Hyphomonadaceae bacterium]
MTKPDTKTRAKAEQAGRRGEAMAALALQIKGYSILETRTKTPRGEIDLIVRKGAVLAFVEVKVRRSTTVSGKVMTGTQMTRIVNAATAWASARPWTRHCQWRYDLVMVAPWRWPRHLKDAWRPINDPMLSRARQAGKVRAGRGL